MKKLSANVCAVTHAGRVRKENEDNYSLNGKVTSDGSLLKGKAYIQKMNEPFHIAVCDGMGGEMHGEVASGIAVETIAAQASNIYDSGADYTFAVSSCLDKANSKICDEINARGVRLGTTLAAVYAVKGRLICASLGDTRIYHFANGILEQASFDHTHGQGLVDARELSEDEISTLPNGKRLTKHLGVFPEEAALSPNISVIDDVENGDVILLCSDGLTDMLSDDEISAVISAGDNPQDVSAKLVRKALERGGKDNITVITAFMTVEEASVFVPIAEAMVGDNEPDYEEEYRASYGDNTADEEGNDPYANADSSAGKKEIDKRKILFIAGAVIAALAAILLAVVIIKAVSARNENNRTTTSLEDYYATMTNTTSTTASNLTLWSSTTEISSIEDTSESDETSDTSSSRVVPKTGTTRGTNPYSSRTSYSNRTTTTTTTRPSQTSSTKVEPTGTTAAPSTTENTSATEPTASSSQTESSSSATQTQSTETSPTSSEREPSYTEES